MEGRKNNKGFTLIEILIALALAGLVMTAVYSTYNIQHKSYLVQEQVTAIQQNLRAALYMMELDFRMMGYDPDGRADSGITIAESDRIRFTYVADDDGLDNDQDGVVDESDEETSVTYEIYDAYGDGDNDLGRAIPTANSGNNLPVAENIDAIDFVYYDGAGNEIDPVTNNNIDDIRIIEVTLVGRAYREDRSYTNNRSYTNDLGEVVLAGGGDHFRRRSLTKQIRGRNLGL